MKKYKSVYFDIDCTTMNTIKAICDLYNDDFKYYKDYRHIDWWEVNSWDFVELNCATKEYINTYFNQPRFFSELEFMPWAKEVISELSEVYQINFVSMGFKPNLILKEKYFLDKFPNSNFIGINMKKYKDKAHIDMSDGLCLDDGATNLITCNAKDKALFGEVYPWNQKWTGRRLINWADVKRYLLD